MRYQLDIHLTEEIYLDFNFFTSIEAKAARKAVIRGRILFLSIMLVCLALVALINGPSIYSFCYAGFIGLFSVLYMILFKKFLKTVEKARIM